MNDMSKGNNWIQYPPWSRIFANIFFYFASTCISQSSPLPLWLFLAFNDQVKGSFFCFHENGRYIFILSVVQNYHFLSSFSPSPPSQEATWSMNNKISIAVIIGFCRRQQQTWDAVPSVARCLPSTFPPSVTTACRQRKEKISSLL